MLHFRADIADKVGRFLISSHFTVELIKVLGKGPNGSGPSNAESSKVQTSVGIQNSLDLLFVHGLPLSFQPKVLQIASKSTWHIDLEFTRSRDGQEGFNLVYWGL